jgi:hypothetical protein
MHIICGSTPQKIDFFGYLEICFFLAISASTPMPNWFSEFAVPEIT